MTSRKIFLRSKGGPSDNKVTTIDLTVFVDRDNKVKVQATYLTVLYLGG